MLSFYHVYSHSSTVLAGAVTFFSHIIEKWQYIKSGTIGILKHILFLYDTSHGLNHVMQLLNLPMSTS